MLFEPCGELRRDYGAYCETLRLTEREEVFSAIITNEEINKDKERRRKLRIMEEAGLEGENAEAEAEALLQAEEEAAAAAMAASAAVTPDPATPRANPSTPTPPKSKKGRSDSTRGKKGTPAKNAEPVAEDARVLYALEPVPTLTFVRIRHPKFCLNQRDITPLCRAIPFCSSLVSVEFTGAGLSVESYMLLTEAIYRSRRVTTVRVDFNCLAQPGFYADPTVAALIEPSPEGASSQSKRMSGAAGGGGGDNSRSGSMTTTPGAATAAPIPAGDAAGAAKKDDKNKKAVGKKDRRLSMSTSVPNSAGTTADGNRAGTITDEPGVIYLKPTEYCGLHLIPTLLEEQINDEKDKKGKVDPKKLVLLQTQQETIQRFNEAHRIRLPRSWEGMLFTSVCHLSLRGNNIDDDCVARMARLIGLNPNSRLISLNLWGNKISDAGAGALARLLRMNRTIRALDLGHNLMSDRGLLDIISVFRMMEMTSTEEINSYRRRVLTRSTASEKERAAAAQPMSFVSVPAYQDMYNVWHALRHPPVVEEKGGKDSGGSAPPPTLSRPSQPFDRDCIRVAPGDPCIRVPGNTVLEVLNLAENELVTVDGVREAVRILSLHEPRTDEDMVLLTMKPDEEEGTFVGPPGLSETLTPPSTCLGLTSPSQPTIYAPELHCAGLRLRTCTLFHYRYDTEDRWEPMAAEQIKLNAALDEWLACGLDAQKPPPPDKGGNSSRRKNH
eukprot:gene1510-895_t